MPKPTMQWTYDLIACYILVDIKLVKNEWWWVVSLDGADDVLQHVGLALTQSYKL